MTTADPQSFNRYTYCDNDPVNKTDALGLMSGADASQSWGDVAGTFWPETTFNENHFGGPDAIDRAIKRLYVKDEDADFDLSSESLAPSSDNKSLLKTRVEFNLNLVDQGLLKTEQLDAMKEEITRIFGQANIVVNYTSIKPDYTLVVMATAPKKGLKKEAVGNTNLSTDGKKVNNLGWVYIDRMNAGAGTGDRWGNDTKNLGIALGRAGSHEVGHYLIQQRDDSQSYAGFMRAKFNGSEWYSFVSRRLWTVTPRQKLLMMPRLRSLEPVSTNGIGPISTLP